MTRCESFEASVSALIDDELEPIERLPTLDHLMACSSCREFYRQARSLDDLLVEADLPRTMAPAPDEVWQRIEAAQTARVASGSPRPAWTAWAGRVAAVLVLGIGLAIVARGLLFPPADRGSYIEVVLEGDRGRMSEERFVELMTEVLEADRRYHHKMLEVMQTVTDPSPHREGPFEGGFGASREGSDSRLVREPTGDRIEGEPALIRNRS